MSILMLIVISSDSLILLNLLKSEILVNIILIIAYLAFSIGLAVYYYSLCYIVFKKEVVNDIINGIVQENPQPIGYKI